MDLSLERMQSALQHLQSPAGSIPAVQVVGTNGKGSIACLIHHGLIAAGLRSGLTTSPHLVSWCERIRVDNALIRIETLRGILESLQPVVEDCRLTPFEQLICAALVHFDQQQPDWLVLEAGLGGRLDATTAHPHRPLIAVASIGLDHREHLGSTLQAIAAEKAAAIGPGAHVVSGPQEAAVQEVLEQRVNAMAGTLEWVEPLDDTWTLGLPGLWQQGNAAVAAAALRWIGRDSGGSPLRRSVKDWQRPDGQDGCSGCAGKDCACAWMAPTTHQPPCNSTGNAAAGQTTEPRRPGSWRFRRTNKPQRCSTSFCIPAIRPGSCRYPVTRAGVRNN